MIVKKSALDMTKVLAHITDAYIILMLTAFLFYCGSGGYEDILNAKFRAFCLICGGYVLVSALLSIEGCLIGAIKVRSPKAVLQESSWAQRFSVLYLAFTWVSALLSPHFPATILGASRYEGAFTITLYVLCFLLVSMFGKASPIMLWTAGISIFVFSVICLAQLSGHNPFALYPDGMSYADAYIEYAGAYLGTVGNVDLVAALLCLFIPILLVSMLRFKGTLHRLLLIPLLAALVVLMKMDVLAGLVGVFGGSFLMLPIIVPFQGKHRRLLGTSVFSSCVIGIVALLLVDTGSGFFHELHQLLHGNFDSAFGSGRIHIWSEVLQAVPSNLLFGAGPDTMSYAGLQAFSRYDADLGATIISRIDVAHNEYLNILFHQGILAALSFTGMLCVCAKKWLKYSPEDPIIAVLGGGLWCYCIQAFFGFSMCITAPLFWIALGLLDSKHIPLGGNKK